LTRWDDVHDGILRGSEPPPLPDSPDHFGVIHGDLNPSNFHLIRVEGESGVEIDVFDFDQCQVGWFLYDMSQPIFAVQMACHAGMPLSGDKVEGLDVDMFTEWLLEGYGGEVDRQGLTACVALRRSLYERFCRRAKAEGDLPAGMAAFIDWVVAAFDEKRL
jgi:uncharacterized protein (DUF2252 family)